MTNYKEVTILTPHFVRRYRERVLENNVSLSSEEVIEKIINKDNFALSFRINDELESIAKCFDGHYKIKEMITSHKLIQGGYLVI